ncbi:MAG: MinD/ParA family protein [Deltaproteobacteria bacterium]|jgi:flagellar biosynthesis protein FlhG|nr:MinD/ParA family protein [Deltaproteobacteria bacterium]
MSKSPPTPKTSFTKPVRVISVSSGKGGVGKSNLTLSLALALAALRKKVLIFDADLGLANTDILLGIHAKYTIYDWIKGEKELKDVILDVPGGIQILPAASGIFELTDIDTEAKSRLITDFGFFEGDLDFMLIDTAAGIGDNVVFFNLVSPEHIMVVLNEPTSITDVYSLIKLLSVNHRQKSFYILPNMVSDLRESKVVFKKICYMAERFLNDVSLDLLGFVPRDGAVPDAVKRQIPFYTLFPQADVSRKISEVARRLISLTPPTSSAGGLTLFLNRLNSNSLTVN